jgi:deazaflavin-dependent oxidoreductase (nitroreductase family)
MVGPMTRQLAGRRLFPLFAVVHHRGRRSDRDYAVPVAIRNTSDGFVIPLPYAGAHWPRNVLAAGECTIRWRGVAYRAVEPRLVGWHEIAHVFNPLLRAIVRLIGIDTFLHLRRLRP